MRTDTPDRILRIKSVLERTGLTHPGDDASQDAERHLPSNVLISERCVGWRESAIGTWLRDPMFYSVETVLPARRGGYAYRTATKAFE